MSVVDLFQLVCACVYAGKLAADEISSVFHSGNLGAIDKANKHKQEKQKLEMIEDPQTLADIRGQQVIVGVLGKLFPSVRLIGEEGELMESGDVDDGVDEIIENLKMEQYRGRFSDELKTLVAKDLIVWIDPLDGTKGFVTGNVDWVTVLIGIAYNGKPIAGVIVQPFGSKLVVWGAVGVGAFGYSILQEPSPDRRIIVSTQHHSTPELEDYIRQLNPTQVINVSGAGGKSLYVLQGLADAYVHPSEGTKKWDTCAPDAIIKAAGGVFTDRFGNEIYYGEDLRVGIMKYQNENGVVVAMRNHQSYIKL